MSLTHTPPGISPEAVPAHLGLALARTKIVGTIGPATCSEDALRELREAGVCVNFVQFKGREPVECGGKSWFLSSRDCDNPFLRASYYGTTGGSTGAAARVAFDLESMTAAPGALREGLLFEWYESTAD